MASDKLTWVELRKAVAQHANSSEQETGQFLNALLDALLIGLKTDKQVKIKGIGTFSLKAIAPRKSVNIVTGESFVIEGYNKLTFSAESNLKESVEKRIEQPKTDEIMAEINPNPLRKLGEQADEIIDILADLGQSPTGDEPKETIIPAEPIEVEEPADTQETPKAEEPIEEPVEESIEEPVEELVEEPVQPVKEPEHKPAPVAKSYNWVAWTIVGILLAIIIGGGIYFRQSIVQWWHCMQDCQPVENMENDTIEAPVSPVVLPLAQQTREYVNFIGIERVGKDSRLSWIAYKYYAQKDLWVFIYEANRDLISHPNQVRPNQYIRIPELDEKWRNLNNPELKQLVDSLAVEYLTIKK